MREMALPAPTGRDRPARKGRPDMDQPRPGRIRVALNDSVPDYHDLAVRMERSETIDAERSA